MTTATPVDEPLKRRKTRPAWRQRLVVVERGLGYGIQQDSILMVHVFTATLIVSAGLVSGLRLVHWTLVGLSLTGLFATELFHQAARAFASTWGETSPPAVKRAVMMSGAAVAITWLGTVITTILALCDTWSPLWAG